MEREEFKIQLTPYNNQVVEIPLYKDLYSLLQLSISTFQQSPKLIQTTLCQKAINLEITLLSLVISAYKEEETKEEYLKKVQDNHLKLYILIKLIIDNSKICQDNSSRFIVLLEQIGKQSNAWLKSRGLEQV